MPKIFSLKFTHISISAGLYDNPVPRIKKCSLLHQVVSGVKKNNAKNFLVKIYPYKYKCRSLIIQCRESKSALYSTRWCQMSKINMPKIFSLKFTHISIIAGLYDNPVPRIKKCSLLHQVVSDVKNNNAKNFFVKIYPLQYICRFR